MPNNEEAEAEAYPGEHDDELAEGKAYELWLHEWLSRELARPAKAFTPPGRPERVILERAAPAPPALEASLQEGKR